MNKGIVMEKTDRHFIVMTRDGQFKRIRIKAGAADADVGEEIHWQSKIQLSRKWMASGMAAAIFLFVFVYALTGLASMNSPIVAYVTLDINPSIEIGMNKNHRVVEAYGLNDAGNLLLERVDFRNKPVNYIAVRLVEEAEEMAYLDPYYSRGDGSIVISGIFLEEGNLNEESLFIEQLGKEVRQALALAHPDQAEAVTVVSFRAPPELREQAASNGVSAGKWAVALLAKEHGVDISTEALRTQAISDAFHEMLISREWKEQWNSKAAAPNWQKLMQIALAADDRHVSPSTSSNDMPAENIEDQAEPADRGSNDSSTASDEGTSTESSDSDQSQTASESAEDESTTDSLTGQDLAVALDQASDLGRNEGLNAETINGDREASSGEVNHADHPGNADRNDADQRSAQTESQSDTDRSVRAGNSNDNPSNQERKAPPADSGFADGVHGNDRGQGVRNAESGNGRSVGEEETEHAEEEQSDDNGRNVRADNPVRVVPPPFQSGNRPGNANPPGLGLDRDNRGNASSRTASDDDDDRGRESRDDRQSRDDDSRDRDSRNNRNNGGSDDADRNRESKDDRQSRDDDSRDRDSRNNRNNGGSGDADRNRESRDDRQSRDNDSSDRNSRNNRNNGNNGDADRNRESRDDRQSRDDDSRDRNSRNDHNNRGSNDRGRQVNDARTDRSGWERNFSDESKVNEIRNELIETIEKRIQENLEALRQDRRSNAEERHPSLERMREELKRLGEEKREDKERLEQNFRALENWIESSSDHDWIERYNELERNWRSWLNR